MENNFNRIITLVDFTGVSKLAIEHTAIIARSSLCLVTLMHIAPLDKSNDEHLIKTKVRDFANYLEEEGVSFSVQIFFGNFFEIIKSSIERLKSDLIIIGTHGIKGVKQNFVSSNISRLIQMIEIPALIIQGHSMLPQEGYLKLMMPLKGINKLNHLVSPVLKIVSIFNSELILLSHFNKENETERTEITKLLHQEMLKLGVQTTYQMEESGSFQNNFAKDIVELADIEQIALICLVFHEQKGNKVFGELDLENILLNKFGIPVLCL
ncbi:MAG TPA: universal stress protein [Bacteroidia bacterium]|nr:universal stress protein [Bacteroidia bacterium]